MPILCYRCGKTNEIQEFDPKIFSNHVQGKCRYCGTISELKIPDLLLLIQSLDSELITLKRQHVHSVVPYTFRQEEHEKKIPSGEVNDEEKNIPPNEKKEEDDNQIQEEKVHSIEETESQTIQKEEISKNQNVPLDGTEKEEIKQNEEQKKKIPEQHSRPKESPNGIKNEQSFDLKRGSEILKKIFQSLILFIVFCAVILGLVLGIRGISSENYSLVTLVVVGILFFLVGIGILGGLEALMRKWKKKYGPFFDFFLGIAFICIITSIQLFVANADDKSKSILLIFHFD